MRVLHFSLSISLPAFILFAFFPNTQGQPRSGREAPFNQVLERYFTVSDSIEMARFERDRTEPEFSPDMKYFAVVTTRGILQSNKLESTLWLFLWGKNKQPSRLDSAVKQLGPARLARVIATPQRQYNDSYEPLITHLSWLQDSKTILFLGQNSYGNRQLYRVTVPSGRVQTLTPQDYDVTEFDSSGASIVYGAARSVKKQTVEEPLASDALEVTGMRLISILFPGMDITKRSIELWAVHNRKSRTLTDPDTGKPVRLANLPPEPYKRLFLSPNGRAAVVLVPSKAIPIGWESYKPTFAYLGLHSKDSDTSSSYWPAQYAFVNLKTGKTELLVDAPNAWALGSADRNQAMWAGNGKEVLITNTYLPLDGLDASEKSKRVQHCAAAVVTIASKASVCVVLADYDRAKRHLLSASFGEDDKTVVLSFWNHPNANTHEEYLYKDNAWKLVKLLADSEYQAITHERSEREGKDPLVAIKQDLNTPPALWLESREGAKERIWDPNPQLATLNLGETSEFRWKDRTGYEWVGGLVKPPNYTSGNRYPLVIQTHGFQANEFMTDGAYTTAFAARPLAAAGMVVLQVPTRRDHLVTGDEASDQIEGFRSAIERLAADGMIDPAKVGIIGFSRTCYYVETALITDPKLFAAATIADGIDESYMQYLLFSVGRSNNEAEQIYGKPPFGTGFRDWIDHAPSFHLDRVRTPLRIEAIGPSSLLAEWELYSSLWKQGKPVDLVYLPDGQHILQKPLERLASQQSNVDWFSFWLKGGEDADPAKAEQYHRWHQLRKMQEENGKKPAGFAQTPN